MDGYRFLYADALTRTVLGELPIDAADYSEVLNRPGALRATMPNRPTRTLLARKPLAQSVLDRGPAVYWRLGDASGVFADRSGNGRDGNLNGSAATRAVAGLVAGDNDRAVELEDGLTFVSNSAFTDDYGAAFTVIGWLRPSSLPATSYIWSLGTTGGSDAFAWLNSAGRITFTTRDNGGFNQALQAPTSANVGVGEEACLAFRWDGAEMALFKDGDLIGTLPASEVRDAGQVFRVGSSAVSTSKFIGTMDEWAAFTTALPDDDIVALTAAGRGDLETTTVVVPTVTEATLYPRRSFVYVERDGVIVWGGMLWTLGVGVRPGTLALGAEGFHSYFRKRKLREDRSYPQVDQTLIAGDLIDYSQVQAGGDIGIDTTGVVASGVLRDRAWFGYERKNIGEAIEQLAAVSGGFDFRYQTDWIGGALVTRFLTAYPASGRPTDHVFELGTNAEVLDLDIEGKSGGWLIDAMGASPGIEATAVDPSKIGVEPLIEEALSFSDVQEAAVLLGHAERHLARTRDPVRIPRLQVLVDAVPVLGSYAVGDIVRVVGSYGYLALDGLYRVTEVSVRSSPDGETAAIGLAALEAFDE